MAGLISDQLINSVRRVAYKQLVTPVKIYRDVHAQGPYGTATTNTLITTVNAWFVPQFKGNLVEQPGGAIAHAGGAEFRFKFDVDVRIGDRLEVAGQTNYVVQDVNTDATILLYLKAWCERTE